MFRRRNNEPARPELPAGVAKGSVRDWAEVACFGVILILFFKTFVAQQFTIPSPSMRETLMIGDHLLTNKFIFARPQWSWEEKLFPMRQVQRGDIIVFRWLCDRNQDWVKRCVALEDDTVEMRQRRLYVNGELITGSWEHHWPSPDQGPVPGPWPKNRDAGDAIPSVGDWPLADPEFVKAEKQGLVDLMGRGAAWHDNLPPVKVPKGYVFAMGDNREQSADSRYWGFLPVDHLRGRPFMIWWSYREGGRDDQRAMAKDGVTDLLSNYADGALHFLNRTRWDRTGTIPR